MKRLYITICFLLAVLSARAHEHVLPPGFALEENFVTGLLRPTDIKIAPDGRIFVAEKAGQIRIIENGVLLNQPFYTVHTQTPNERGLGGILLDPDFENNGYVYLFYTLPFENKNKVARVTAAGNTALPGSEIELIRFDAMYAAWHNGGGMAFDSTGKLIIGTGDGTAFITAQNLQNTLGKLLRINPDGTLPTDNEWYTQLTGEYRAIVAYGVRNPYTMARSRLSNRIFFNDVGNDDFEEVDEYVMGSNYGWYPHEGYIGNASPQDPNYRDPIHVYDHDYGCAIVGATFYEPDLNRFPIEYYGKYFFMEYCEGKVMCMDPDDHSVTEFGSGFGKGYCNLETSRDGYLYLINYSKGIVSRISYQGLNAPPLISIQPTAQIVPVGADVKFEVDAIGDTLIYEWFRNGIKVQGGARNSFQLRDVQMHDTQSVIFVKVTNPNGFVFSDTVSLRVVNGSPPVIHFENVSRTYAAGDTIHFSAKVWDAEQPVSTADFNWWIDFHHDEHLHPAMSDLSGVDAGIYVVGEVGEVDTNVFFRVHLSVTDTSGLNSTAFTDVHPEKVTINLSSTPPGVDITVDGLEGRTNYNLRSVQNLRRTVDVPVYAVLGDSLYEFVEWENGSDSLTRTFSAQNDSLHAQYTAIARYYSAVDTLGVLEYYRDTALQNYYKSSNVPWVRANWDVLGPLPYEDPPFDKENFSIRWAGGTVAPVSDWYTFYLFHDGKASLLLGDTVLIDGIVATGDLQEDTVQVWLNGGDSLALEVHYDHYKYISRVELAWSYSLVERRLVPFGRPPLPVVLPPGKTTDRLYLFPNPTGTGTVSLCINLDKHAQQPIEITATDDQGRGMYWHEGIVENATLPVNVEEWPAGLYLFRVTIGETQEVLRFVKQ